MGQTEYRKWHVDPKTGLGRGGGTRRPSNWATPNRTGCGSGGSGVGGTPHWQPLHTGIFTSSHASHISHSTATASGTSLGNLRLSTTSQLLSCRIACPPPGDSVKTLQAITFDARGTLTSPTLGVVATCFKTLLTAIRQPLKYIHILDDDSLLNVFHFCRPNVLEEDKYGSLLLRDLAGEHWWYKFTQVCRRWRYLILGSASHLRLALLCTRGTPVADMLLHSPPLPLIINHDDQDNDITAEDEEGIKLALRHRDRVQRINLQMPVPSLQKLVTAIHGEFPILEFLNIKPPAKQNARLSLPSTFEAPQLRHLWLDYFTSPIRYPFLTRAVGLVTLFLPWTHASTYVQPEHILRALSLLPHLERLAIGFVSAIPNSEIKSQLSHTPITTRVTLSNLRRFFFCGVSRYLERLLSHMTAPLLHMLNVNFFNQLSFSVPRLLQFMVTTEYFRYSRAVLLFYHEGVFMYLNNPLAGTERALSTRLNANITCKHLDWQVLSIAQIFDYLRPLLSSVTDLTLDYREHTLSSELHNEVSSILWRQILESFRNVDILRVHKGLVGGVSRSLRLDGEQPQELLPELKELVCPTGSVEDKIFSPFIHDRDVAGQPVKLIEETFPVKQTSYRLRTSNGVIDIAQDPDPRT